MLSASRAPNRSGPIRGLEDPNQFDVSIAPANLDGVIRAMHQTRPHVLVLDLPLDGLSSLAAIMRLHERVSAVPIVAVGAERGAALVDRALQAGASGFVLRDEAEHELAGAVRAALNGHEYVSASIAPALAALRDSLRAHDLDERETAVLGLVALGHTTGEMARRLGLSPRTIDSERAAIERKLGLGTRAELVQFALARGLLGR